MNLTWAQKLERTATQHAALPNANSVRKNIICEISLFEFIFVGFRTLAPFNLETSVKR